MPSTAWTLGRLHKTAEFERVRKEGARWRGRLCALNAARALSFSTTEASEARMSGSRDSGTRIGLITSKAVGGAVQRNRARRLMREAVRALAAAEVLPAGWDLVLIAQKALGDKGVRMQHVREEILWLLTKASIAKSSSNPSPQAPASGTASSAAR
jgi:ribonuclease P protein component